MGRLARSVAVVVAAVAAVASTNGCNALIGVSDPALVAAPVRVERSEVRVARGGRTKVTFTIDGSRAFRFVDAVLPDGVRVTRSEVSSDGTVAAVWVEAANDIEPVSGKATFNFQGVTRRLSLERPLRVGASGTVDEAFVANGAAELNSHGADVPRSTPIVVARPVDNGVRAEAAYDHALYVVSPLLGRTLITRLAEDGAIDATFGVGGTIAIDLETPTTECGTVETAFHGEDMYLLASCTRGTGPRSRLWRIPLTGAGATEHKAGECICAAPIGFTRGATDLLIVETRSATCATTCRTANMLGVCDPDGNNCLPYEPPPDTRFRSATDGSYAKGGTFRLETATGVTSADGAYLLMSYEVEGARYDVWRINPRSVDGNLERDTTFGTSNGVAGLTGFSRQPHPPDDTTQPFYPVLIAVPDSIEVAAFAGYRQAPRLPVRGLTALLVDGRSRYGFVKGFPLDARAAEDGLTAAATVGVDARGRILVGRRRRDQGILQRFTYDADTNIAATDSSFSGEWGVLPLGRDCDVRSVAMDEDGLILAACETSTGTTVLRVWP